MAATTQVRLLVWTSLRVRATAVDRQPRILPRVRARPQYKRQAAGRLRLNCDQRRKQPLHHANAVANRRPRTAALARMMAQRGQPTVAVAQHRKLAPLPRSERADQLLKRHPAPQPELKRGAAPPTQVASREPQTPPTQLDRPRACVLHVMRRHAHRQMQDSLALMTAAMGPACEYTWPGSNWRPSAC